MQAGSPRAGAGPLGVDGIEFTQFVECRIDGPADEDISPRVAVDLGP